MCGATILTGLLAGLLVLGFAVTSAQAGFILETVEVDLPGHGQHGPPPWAQCPDWVKQMIQERLQLRLQEKFEGSESFPVEISGETDEDPIMHIVKDVENSSGVDRQVNPRRLRDHGVPRRMFSMNASMSRRVVAGFMKTAFSPGRRRMRPRSS